MVPLRSSAQDALAFTRGAPAARSVAAGSVAAGFVAAGPVATRLSSGHLIGAILIGAMLVGCGSSSPEPASSPESSASGVTTNEETPVSTSELQEPAAPTANCDDGTCFLCGEGLCPQGAYCDDSAPQGPACAWLGECPASPSCGCVLSVLGSSCDCEVANGGPHVTCRN